MNYQKIFPGESFRGSIRTFWVMEGSASLSNPLLMRTFARAFPQLIFQYRGVFKKVPANRTWGESLFLSGVHGQTNTFLDFQASEDFGVFGIEFFPNALPALFGIPAGAFLNQLPDLHSILKSNDISLHERMYNARDNNERLLIITAFLKSRIDGSEDRVIAFAVNSIIRNRGLLNIKALAEECCCSQRHFERKFKILTGFSAKSFSRIVRFNSLLDQADYENQTLTEIALNFGYYDQSHFINDFRQFTGYSPKEYFSTANE